MSIFDALCVCVWVGWTLADDAMSGPLQRAHLFRKAAKGMRRAASDLIPPGTDVMSIPQRRLLIWNEMQAIARLSDGMAAALSRGSRGAAI